jgi:endonuclease YncB( thermonuclease family)
MGNCNFAITKNNMNNNDSNMNNEIKDATFNNSLLLTYNFTKAKIIKVYDGDTVWIAIKFYNGKIYKFLARIYGIDCSELRSHDLKEKEDAIKAKEFTTNFCLNKIVDINIFNNKLDDKNKIIKEKYGRLLISIEYEGLNLANELIKNGFAKKYYGGKK